MLEAPALVAGFNDVAVMGQPVEQRGGHLGIAEDGRPFAEGEVGRDDDRGMLVEPADQMEQELSAGTGKRQVAEFIKDQQIEAGRVFGKLAGPPLMGL